MKSRFTFSILFLFLAAALSAQVKIGNNPNTMDSNALLEMESTNKGFLPPRMALNSASSVSPLTGTVTAGMLVYSTGGTLADGYYYWSGTQWTRLVSSTERSNYVLVKSAADFPAASGGVITLSSGTVYEVNGTIMLTSKINLNGSWLTGVDAVNDKLIYTPSSGELFTGSNGGNIRNLSLTALTAGAKLFNLDAAGGAKNFVIQNCYMLGCDNVGLIKGFGGTVAFFYNTNGITFENNFNLMLTNMLWDVTNKNTFEKYTGTFSLIQKLAGDIATSSANNAIGMDVSGITSLQTGELKTVLFTGNGTNVLGTFSSKWEVESAGLPTEKDAVSSGNIYVSTPATTLFAAMNTPVKVSGTTTAASLFRVTAPTSNRLAYTGTKTRTFQVICSLSMLAASSNRSYSFYISKNGSLLPESKQFLKLGSNADRGTVTLSCMVSMNTNDYVEVWVENNSDNSSLTVETLNLAIK
jgi:hypothetical protein